MANITLPATTDYQPWLKETLRPAVSSARQRLFDAIVTGINSGTWTLTPYQFPGSTLLLFRITAVSPHNALPDKRLSIQEVRGKLSLDMTNRGSLSIRKACEVVTDPWTAEVAAQQEYVERRRKRAEQMKTANQAPAIRSPSAQEVEGQLFWEFIERGRYNETVRAVSCDTAAWLAGQCAQKLAHLHPIIVDLSALFHEEMRAEREELDIPVETIERTLAAGPADATNWNMLQSFINRFWHRVVGRVNGYTVLYNVDTLATYGCMHKLASFTDRPVVVLTSQPTKDLPFHVRFCRAYPKE